MPHNYSVLIIVLLVLFAVYRRIRRNIGFQLLSRTRLLTRSFIFIAIGILLLIASYAYPLAYLSDGLGVILGLILAYFAIKTTQFERREKGWMYRANGWIGGIVIVLFLARLIYRFYVMSQVMNSVSGSGVHGTGMSAQAQTGLYIGDPWTAGIIFILFSYYPCYFLFLARKVKHLDTEARSM